MNTVCSNTCTLNQLSLKYPFMLLALTGYFKDTGYLVSLPQRNFDNTPIIAKCCSNYQSVTPQKKILEDNSCLNLNFQCRANFPLNFEHAFHHEVTPDWSPGYVGWRRLWERTDLWTNEGDDRDGPSERKRQRERERKQCSKRDDSVDKVKLEIKSADGGAKNVTCQVACGTPGRGRRIRTVGR